MKEKLQCDHCGEIFDLDEADARDEYVDDSSICAYQTPICPICGSDELTDIEVEDEDEDE